MRAGDGSVREAHLRASPLDADDAKGAVFLDVTDVASGAIVRAERDRRFVAILDAIPAPIWFKDARGIYEGCNTAFEKFIGLPRDEIVGRTVFDVAPEDLAKVYRRADDALLMSGGVQRYETQVQWADGTRRKVLMSKATIRDAAGDIVGLAGTMLDLTEQRAAEASFRQFVDSTPELVLIHRDRRILYANPAVCAVLGCAPDEVVGSDVGAWIHPDDRPAVLPRLDATKRLPSAELRLRRCDGSWIHAEFFSIAIEVEGGPARMAIGRDLTERRQAQERIARAERLAAIGTLAAGVAHELNNPLTFVLSNVEFVGDHLRAERCSPGCCTDEHTEALRALDDALEGAERMRDIVRDLRSMAGPDATREGAVDVRRVLEYAANVAANEVRRRARLTWDIGEVPPVRGNEARLGQVLLNLVINAAHAIPEGAPDRNEIRLAAQLAGEDRVAISVIDTGVGMAPEVVSRVFDPFFTTKPVGVGTGLGLWICHSIISAHGGTIDVESAPGRGTTFRVVLHAARGPAAASSADRRERRVLVIDDEPLVTATVRRHLGREFAVDAASSPMDAMARLAAGARYEAVVCDVVMPGGGGLALLEALRREHPELASRVVFVTGGGCRTDASCLAASGAPCLEKPFDGAQLRAALRDLLGPPMAAG